MSEVGGGGGGRFPLYARVLLGVVLGVIAAEVGGMRVAPLADVGGLVIRLLKMLATPLVMLAVIDAMLRTEIPARKAGRLVAISLLNACVAIGIGLGVANVMQAGVVMRGQVAALAAEVGPSTQAAVPSAHVATGASKPAATLDPLSNLSAYIPESIVEPFTRNSVISVVLLAVVLGAALRKLKDGRMPSVVQSIEVVEHLVRAMLAAFVQVLTWVVGLLPFAVFGVIAGVVAKTGNRVFLVLGAFLGTVVLGLALHAIVYYAALIRTAGRMSPIAFFRGAADAIVTALSCGSSLATLPVTLRCLDEKLKVSVGSSRLAACVGTNLNHDGIILYEAAAAIFVAQAFGFDLTLTQQVTIGIASVMAGLGIAGVPEAGLITLPLVLGAAGLPESVVATAIPLLLPVDWIIGRCRAATNVTSDMTVAVLLDATDPAPASSVARDG